MHSILGEERFARFSAFKETGTGPMWARTLGQFGHKEVSFDLKTNDGQRGAGGSTTSIDAQGNEKMEAYGTPPYLKLELPEVFQRLVNEGRLKPQDGNLR